MASIELDLDHEINRTVSHLPGVRASVRSEADKIEVKAQANLEAHRDVTNATDHTITSEQDGVDALVSLEGPAPASVNGVTGTPEISAVSPNTFPAFTSLQRRRALSKKETPWLLEECLGSSLLYSRFYGRSWRLNTPISQSVPGMPT